MALIPIIDLPPDFGQVSGLWKIRPASREAIRPGQGIAAHSDRSLAMGKDWNNAVGANRREGGRLEQHSRPDFSGAEIIDKTEGGLPEDFGSEVDLDLGIVMDSQLGTSAFQSIEDGAD